MAVKSELDFVDDGSKGYPWFVRAKAFLRRFDKPGAPVGTPAQGKNGVRQAVEAELRRAVEKFPTWPTDPLHAVAVLGEEFGELTQAVLQSVYEPAKSNPEEVRKEAVQVAAMAIRFLDSLEEYDYRPGAQHSQAGDAQKD